jgi:hypothetical protein
MRRTPLVIAAMASAMAITSAPALASDGWSRDRNNLEPGCFMPDGYGHWGNGYGGSVDLDSHLDLTALMDHEFVKELHVTVRDNAPFSVDQVLVRGVHDGYNIYNQFDTGSRTDDPDVDPNQTAVDLFAPDGKYLDKDGTIVCVSDHDDAGQNEPYGESGHHLYVKDSPILAPKVTAFGQSALRGERTYRIGFGYGVERWYAGYRHNQDAITIFPRADGTYDSHGVNDVDKAGESWASLFNVSNESDASDGQTFLFHKSGDMTAWSDSSLRGYDLDHERRYLLTDLTQGDLPMSWTLRPTLASPSSKRTATMTLADFFAWNKSWQDFYAGKAGMPGTVAGTLPLAPGTNSPDIDPSITVVNNVTVTQPAPTPSNPTPAPVVTVNPPAVGNVTVGAVTPAAGQQISGAVNAGASCKSNRVIKIRWSKNIRKGHVRYWNKTATGKMSGGRLTATLDFRGYAGHPGSLMKVTQISTRKSGRTSIRLRVFKVC